MDYIEHYRIDAEEFDYFDRGKLTPDERRRRETILNLCPAQPGQKVLEIGSGSGWFSLAMAERGVNATAMDLSEANLERIREQDLRVQTVYGDAHCPPDSGERYDWIVTVEVLEHLPEPAAAIAAWKELLAPQGRILCAVPENENIQYVLCVHCNHKTPVHAHLHRFDRPGFRKLFRESGLRLISTTSFLNPGLITFRLNRLLARLPFRVWRKLDQLAIETTDRARFIAIVARRP